MTNLVSIPDYMNIWTHIQSRGDCFYDDVVDRKIDAFGFEFFSKAYYRINFATNGAVRMRNSSLEKNFFKTYKVKK